MNIIKVKDYDELSVVAANFLIEKVKESPELVLGLATGGTPEGMYKYLIKDHREKHTTYSRITTFNLDEYIGLPPYHPNSYRYYMNSRLLDYIDIDKSRVNIPRGDLENPEAECYRYEELIKQNNGIDLQVLGIGANGHIGFNEPGSSMQSRTHIVQLAPSTRSDNARYFQSVEEVPTHAITMGIATIMESKEILLLASGNGKREALKRLLEGGVSVEFPASILNEHPQVTIIADEAALKDLALT